MAAIFHTFLNWILSPFDVIIIVVVIIIIIIIIITITITIRECASTLYLGLITPFLIALIQNQNSNTQAFRQH